MGNVSLVVWDLQEFAQQGTENLKPYVGISPVFLYIAAAVALVLVLAVIILGVICFKRRGKKGEGPMKKAGAFGNGTVDRISIGKLHEQGERSGQQDCFGVSDESLITSHGLLAVVADGMGGLSNGDLVSSAAVETILDAFTLYQGNALPQQLLLMLACQAVERVNGLLGPEGLKKSGSTLVMGLVKNERFFFLSVGDSRVCLYRHGILMQLNREHIYQNELALRAVNGEIPLQEIYTDSRKSGLTSFLGMGQLAHIDMPSEPIELVPGDKLILMSDGVYNALEPGELTESLLGSPQEAVEMLRTAIEEKGYTNQDNYTAVVIGCEAREGEEKC